MMPVLTPELAVELAYAGASCRVAADVAPRFRVGDRVRVRNINPESHTRLPRYVRGKVGTIERDHGVFAFPDTHAHGLGDKPQHVYCVRFSARELWGEKVNDRDSLVADLFDDYMDLA